MRKSVLILSLSLAALAGAGLAIYFVYNYLPASPKGQIASFEECVRLGNPVMESYPRQCRDSFGKVFVENIGNESEKTDLIKVSEPRPNQVVKSPLAVKGEARGVWFFEASFPIKLYDSNGKQIGLGVAQAQSDWMTENFVPFSVILKFEKPETPYGTLILQKDNPSGLPEHEDQLVVPVSF
ncbi:Gmad2 immunoglobulin-like domain-containing protein [Candidatus Giovannonibacteria bacterium]|nr:Gmad2 immunoglobulin-like domain-containing protein [Candidatus Giovannonibacteria bacterium]